MLESDRNWVVSSDYLRYSQHISEYVKYSVTTYFIHSNTHIITGYILTIDQSSLGSTYFSTVHKIMAHLTTDSFLGAMKYGNFC